MENIDIKNVLIFDTETTGVPDRNLKWEDDFEKFPHVVQIAWSIGDKERSYIIYPDGYEIPEETTKIHGITTQMAIEQGKPFGEVIQEFIADAENAELVCAHNIYFDTSIIKANILMTVGKEYCETVANHALYKGKRIDTMRKTIKFVGACYANGRRGKFPKLEELYAKLFDNETYPAHNALEDVRALKKCLGPLVEMGLIELKLKEYNDESGNIDNSKKKIEFNDPNPIEIPEEQKKQSDEKQIKKKNRISRMLENDNF